MAQAEAQGQARCPYCSASNLRCAVVGGGRSYTECRTCGRIVEERLSEVDELFIERAHDAPLCIVTPDFSENQTYVPPPIEDDPFESIGFITAFSTWSLEYAPLFTATSTSCSGDLAELERVLSDTLYYGGAIGTGLNGHVSIVDSLRAYFHILEVCSVLELQRDSCDNAIQLFKDCLATTYFRNRNIEALATAAIMQALKEGQENRSLQEVSLAANIPQKEIVRHMKVLSEALKLTQPINSNTISIYMPRFCNLLQLSKTTQDLATHIGEVVINKNFCTRRNPISISAAAIYLACQLEDKRKTQTEICKATSLTEVTLRKVYKELLENLDELLPPDYTPAVPVEKTFSVQAAALGRVHGPRVGLEASYSDPSISTATYNAAVSNGLPGDTKSAVGGVATGSPAQSNTVRVAAPADWRTAAAPYWVANPAISDGRHAEPAFTYAQGGERATNGTQAGDRSRLEGAKGIMGDSGGHDSKREREPDMIGLKNANVMPVAGVSDLRPPFLPFGHFYPGVYQDVRPQGRPLQAYGTHDMRFEERPTASRGNEGTQEAVEGNPHLQNSNTPQHYVRYLPAMPDASNPFMQIKLVSPVQGRPPDAADRQGVDKRDGNAERGRDHPAEASEGGSHATTLPTLNPVAVQTFAAAAAAAAAAGKQGGPMFHGFASGMWPFVGVGAPYRGYPQVFPAPGGGFPKGLRKGENQFGASEKKMEKFSEGLSTLSGAEGFARVKGRAVASNNNGEVGGQLTHLTMPWASNVPFHPYGIQSSPSAGGAIVSNEINDTSGGKKNDEAGGRDFNVAVRQPASREGVKLAQQPVAEAPMPSFGGTHGRGSSSVFSANAAQHPDSEPLTTARSNRASVERQVPHG